MVIVGVKDGAGVKKLIKKYAVMLNSLLSVICFLPSVDSSENLTDDEDKTAITNSISLTYPSNNNGTSNEEEPADAEIANIAFGIVIGILTLIISGLTLYHQYYKKEQEKKKELEQGPKKNQVGRNYIWCWLCNNLSNESEPEPGPEVYVTYDI